MMTEKWVEAQQAMQNTTGMLQVNEVRNEQTCCGRSYNEVSDFSQVNFAAFQSILDRRNELLSTVKAQSLL